MRETKKQKKTAKQQVYTILYLICILVFLFSLYKVVDGVFEYREAEKIYEETQDEFIKVPEEEKKEIPIEVDFDELLKINSDIVGWIYIDDTVVNYPILQSTDNQYYLDRTLYKGYLASGSIFLDYRSSSNFTDSHSISYGHNMKNQTMFGDMDDFEEGEYMEEHPYVYILLPDGQCWKYAIYSAYIADVYDGTFNLHQAAGSDFDSFIDLTLSKNIYTEEYVDEDVLPDGADKIITLSTCTEDSDDYRRFVVHAVFVEEVEEK